MNKQPVGSGLVNEPRMLEILFPEPESRPCLRWLKDLRKAGKLPYVRMGRLIFYQPDKVMEEVEKVFLVRSIEVTT